jgi:PiT family inorganic phosphate transporter
MYYFIERRILSVKNPYRSAEHHAPFLVFSVSVVIILSVIFKGLKNLHLQVNFLNALLLAVPLAGLAGVFARKWVKWHVRRCEIYPEQVPFTPVEGLFAQLQILTASYVAFAHGANDVANAVGPLAAIFSVIKTKNVALHVQVPVWMLLAGGVAVGGGLMAFGTRVMKTIGKNITEITPVRGFCAEFGSATTILICSRLGFPISTTHVLVGAVVGVGIMRGMGTLDLRVLKNIALSWIVTLPFTIILSIFLYKLFILFLV